MRRVRPRGPDFLVIGAQRAGTTWLHRVLSQHPALWVSPVKELHYFDKPATLRTVMNRRERRRVGLSGLMSLDPWYMRYWFGTRSDEWYARLFHRAQTRGLIAGEVTPAYATLNEDVFRRIHRMNSEIKLAFVMRDPVERVWSAVCNAYKKGKGRARETLRAEEVLSWMREPRRASRSAYMDTIERIEAIFPKRKLHYCFFDDLRDQPESFAREMFSFLGVDPNRVEDIELPQAVNAAAGNRPVPPALALEMAKDYLPMVGELCRRFGDTPERWRARYEKMLSSSRASPSEPPLSVSVPFGERERH